MPIQGMTKKKSSGKGMPSNRPLLTRKEAVMEAEYIERGNKISLLAHTVLETVALMGAMTTHQLMRVTRVSLRSLERYHHANWLDWSPYPERLKAFNLPTSKQARVYTLGIVGVELARRKKWVSETYAGYNFHPMIHDVLCNQVAIELLQYSKKVNVSYEWGGAYESRLYDSEGNVVLEPDALLKFGVAGNWQQVYALEYHNETDRRRVGNKVQRYERVNRENRELRRYWQVDTMPTVLVAFTHKIVLDGYVGVLREWGQSHIQCRYLAKSLKKALNPEDEIYLWHDLNHKAFTDEWQRVSLL